MIKNLWNNTRASEARTYRLPPMDWSELHRAVDNDNLKRIEKLAEDPIELSTRDRAGRGALHLAVFKGSLAAANLLLKAGAHVDAQDIAGISPLHSAVTKGNISMVKLLVNYGASPTLKNDKSDTALKAANGNPLMEEVLKESYGSYDVNAFDSPTKKSSKYFGLDLKLLR